MPEDGFIRNIRELALECGGSRATEAPDEVSDFFTVRCLLPRSAAEDGVSAVEFALVSAVLVIPLVIGGYDIGTALFGWMAVGYAARAGAAYATYCGFFNQTNIVNAVSNATALSSIQPTPRKTLR